MSAAASPATAALTAPEILDAVLKDSSHGTNLRRGRRVLKDLVVVVGVLLFWQSLGLRYGSRGPFG